jgi:membrane-anchored protein YejM (alkaline phosphatase superfamily)
VDDEKKSPWATGWKIFSVVLFVVLILIIIFWKKIWKWFKGEREQERKVREQLDIF